MLAGTVFHLLGAAPGRFAAAGAGAGADTLLGRAATVHAAVGWRTAAVQTLAVLEVVHSLLGWVRSPLATVSMQVASRLFVVWGINAFFPPVRPPAPSPLCAS